VGLAVVESVPSLLGDGAGLWPSGSLLVRGFASVTSHGAVCAFVREPSRLV
jgi:hypothetical protein